MTYRTASRVMTYLGIFAIFAIAQIWSAEARAQVGPYNCPAVSTTVQLPSNQPNLVLMPTIPEISTHPSPGVLRGVVTLKNAKESLQVNSLNAPAPPTRQCMDQLLRFFVGGQPPVTFDPTNVPPLPVPGPTLRAQLGDIVELTFLNQIDPRDYNGTIDVPPNGIGAGCDTSTSGYPNLGPDKSNTIKQPVLDTYPNCFHASSTANLHFHGTHTSPTSTGDNVFLAVEPSPRDATGPTITEATFQTAYNSFFSTCERSLRANNKNQWPVTWPAALNASTTYNYSNLPANWEQDPLGWTYKQAQLLVANDPTSLKADVTLSSMRLWPQDYLGSVPYCFVLPNYQDPTQRLMMYQAPGTHWYHAHKHGSTANNVANSMAGAFIIEGNGYDGVFNKYYGAGWTRKQPVMVVNQLGTTPGLERTGAGRPGEGPFSINGEQQPTILMQPGEVQLWRIVNASSVSGFYLAGLPAGFQWRQTAQDGVQFDAYNYATRAQRPVFVAAGNRIDILVQAPLTTGLATVQVRFGASEVAAITPKNNRLVNFLNVYVTGNQVSPPQKLLTAAEIGPRPPFLDDLSWPVGSRPTRTFDFNSSGAGGQRQHTINGMKFDPEHPVVINNVNSVEEWQIFNSTTIGGGIDHPFHIHVNPFQVTAVFAPTGPLTDTNFQVVYDTSGATPVQVQRYYATTAPPTNTKWLAYQCALDPSNRATWVPCTKPLYPVQGAQAGVSAPARPTNIWWDVFPIPAGLLAPPAVGQTPSITIPGYFKMLTRFADYQGVYVMHCHILAHEDRGMMMSVQVGMANPATMFMHH